VQAPLVVEREGGERARVEEREKGEREEVKGREVERRGVAVVGRLPTLRHLEICCGTTACTSWHSGPRAHLPIKHTCQRASFTLKTIPINGVYCFSDHSNQQDVLLLRLHSPPKRWLDREAGKDIEGLFVSGLGLLLGLRVEGNLKPKNPKP
jgi:hypothetical protein